MSWTERATWNHVCYPFVISFCYCILLSLIKYYFDIKSIYFRNDISSSKLILLLHQNVKIEKALSVVCSYFWFRLYTIKSILVNINIPHLYIVHYEDVNSKFHILRRHLGLPWWLSGWESACQCRGHGFEPWSGKIPHAVEQLGPWATITEPAHLEPVLRNKRGRDNERPVHRDEEWPPLATTRESPRTETKTQHSHK